MLHLLLLLAAFQSGPPRDAAPPPRVEASAVVRGRVLDKASGDPIPGARVAVAGTGAGRTQRETYTDAEGRYAVTSLPAGDYVLVAAAGEMRATHLGQFLDSPAPASRDSISPPRPFTLGPGQIRDGADIHLTRALAIEGLVLDDAGEPIANARVSVQRAGAGSIGEARETDDRGFFRLFGLSPGAYRLCATPGHVSSTGDVPAATRLTRTCHPATADSGPAAYIRLTTTDVTDITLRLVRSGTYTLSGSVFDAAGEPAVNPSVTLHRQMGEGEMTSTGLLLRGHEFRVADLEPGDYVLQASVGSAWKDRRVAPLETALVPIRVDADVTGLPVFTTRGSVVTGRVTFEGHRPPHSAMTVQSRREDDLARAVRDTPVTAPVAADGTFVLERVFGPQVLVVSGVPDEWFVKAVRYGGRDIAHAPTLFPEGTARGVEVVMSSEGGAHLRAAVRDADGSPASMCSVVLLPVEGAQWGIVSARSRSPFPEDGGCDLGVVRPGEYFVLALSPAVEMSLLRRDGLVRWLAESGATRVTLAPGERRSVVVTERSVPEGR